MTVPFMRAYSQLLVKTCHKRGAHAIGGMAAFIPSRRDEEVNRVAFEKVRADKALESKDGFDGTWVAHPDLVSVAMGEFDKYLTETPHQKHRLREDVKVSASDLLNFDVEGGKVTRGGVQLNINVAILYIASWLDGYGAAALYNLMEDAATAEISRAQLWQWLRHKAVLEDGTEMDHTLYRELRIRELETIKELVGDEAFEQGNYRMAADILDSLVQGEDFIEFLTLPAYEAL